MKALACLLLFVSIALHAQGPPPLSQPEKDFETFWKTFRDQYAFFQLKGVNWDSTYALYRPQVSKRTTEKQLLGILERMVAPLNDGHITLSKGETVIFKARKPSYFREEFNGLEKQFWHTVDTTLAQNGFQHLAGVGPLFKDKHLYYVSKTPHIGYIRITRCFGEAASLFDDAREAADTRLMLRLFDSLLQDLSTCQALIIDLRGNGGGHAGTDLASRLVKTRTLTHYKSVRLNGSGGTLASAEAQYIEPSAGTRFVKPVCILTNDRTASSAEDFTLALCQQDNVSTIGSNTSGMLSDMYSGELSKGIAFTLSNQVYFSTDKEMLEDRGIAPRYRVENRREDIARHRDPVLLKALEVLNQKP